MAPGGAGGRERLLGRGVDGPPLLPTARLLLESLSDVFAGRFGTQLLCYVFQWCQRTYEDVGIVCKECDGMFFVVVFKCRMRTQPGSSKDYSNSDKTLL